MSLRAKPTLHQDSALALAEDLRPLLHRLMREMRREDLDLEATPLQALLLGNILKHPGIGVVELAQLEKLRGPTVSSHVKALEKLGLIARGAPDPQDRRRIGLVVTDEGRRVLVDLKQRRTDWLAERLAGLSPEARQLLRGRHPRPGGHPAMTAAGAGAHGPHLAEPASEREIRQVFIGLMIVLALGSIDQNIVATALPRIVSELAGSPICPGW